jgi:hypothetical protein
MPRKIETGSGQELPEGCLVTGSAGQLGMFQTVTDAATFSPINTCHLNSLRPATFWPFFGGR